MDTAVLVGRLVLAGVFAVAAVMKLRDRQGTVETLVAFRLPGRAARLAAPVLPLVELAVALALLFTTTAVAAAIAAAALLGIFTAGIVNALAHGHTPDCGCFGATRSQPISARMVARNAVLFLIAVFAAARGPGASIPGWLAVAIAAAAALAAVLIWRRRTPAAPDQQSVTIDASQEETGLEVGMPAPEFELAGPCAGARTLSSLLAPSLPVVLLFLDGGCGSCSELHPHLGRWQTTLAERLRIAIVSGGDPEAARRLCEDHSVADVLVDDPSAPVSRAYRMPGNPSAVAIAPDGRIASTAVRGADAIEELVRLTIHRAPEGAAAWSHPSRVA